MSTPRLRNINCWSGILDGHLFLKTSIATHLILMSLKTKQMYYEWRMTVVASYWTKVKGIWNLIICHVFFIRATILTIKWINYNFIFSASSEACDCNNIVGLNLANTMVAKSGKLVAEAMVQMKKVRHIFQFRTLGNLKNDRNVYNEQLYHFLLFLGWK